MRSILSHVKTKLQPGRRTIPYYFVRILVTKRQNFFLSFTVILKKKLFNNLPNVPETLSWNTYELNMIIKQAPMIKKIQFSLELITKSTKNRLHIHWHETQIFPAVIMQKSINSVYLQLHLCFYKCTIYIIYLLRLIPVRCARKLTRQGKKKLNFK